MKIGVTISTNILVSKDFCIRFQGIEIDFIRKGEGFKMNNSPLQGCYRRTFPIALLTTGAGTVCLYIYVCMNVCRPLSLCMYVCMYG